MMRWLGQENGEEVTPFFFVQLSDAHVGFNGPAEGQLGRTGGV